MIKFIECPDFHLSPSWLETSKQCAAAVRKAAIDNQVDFIAFPGDFWDRPVLASDQGGINAARDIIKSLVAVCPVVAIEGTPSHDAPGAYGPLTDCGLQLLYPGKAYTNLPGVVLFGIPELNKDGIHAALSASSEQANLEAEGMLANYVAEFIAPHRELHANRVAVCLIHGNVTDARRENMQDMVLKASDILIRTEILEPANVDRFPVGHIHIPWESTIVSAGYAGFTGIDGNPFGKTGFKPAMNLVAIEAPGCKPVITRIPYGTPERRKITKPLAVYDPDIAYWLDTDDQAAECPTGHAWSRVTHRPIERESALVEVHQEMSLPEIFRAWDKNVTASVIEKVKDISRTVTPQALEPLDIQVASVEIDGCIFWKDGYIKFDIAESPAGVSRMAGRMGDGKSSLLGFCTPYPVIVGKDTESGRTSAIKEFFNGENSRIEKIIYRNGIQHRHLITIKAAHTKSAKTECYLYIGSENQLDTTSFDEMMEKCEALYGPYSDYLLTTFYVQPLQSSQGPGLMAAKKVDARNVVQAIAGVNRESESRYSLDQKSATGKARDEKAAWIAGAEQFVESSESVQLAIDTMSEIGRDASNKMQLLAETGKTAKQEVDQLQSLANASRAESDRKAGNEYRKTELTTKKAGLQFSANMLESNKAMLVDILAAKQIEQKNTDLKNAYDTAVLDWNRRLMEAKQVVALANQTESSKYQAALREYNAAYQATVDKIDTENTTKRNQYNQAMAEYSARKSALEADQTRMEAITVTACIKCGYIEETASAKYQEAQQRINDIRILLAAMVEPTAPQYATRPTPEPPVEPNYQTEPETLSEPLPEPPAYLQAETPPFSEESIRAKISEGEIAGSKIAEIDRELVALAAMTYQIDETVDARLQEANAKTESLRQQYADERSRKEKAEHEITALTTKLESIAGQLAKIQEARLALETIEANLTDWTYIAKAFQPANIPALELEMSIQAIDFEATRILKPFSEGQYTIRTEAADGFDILVYDGETAKETSFFKRNPGHKAFFSDTYTKALIRQRNERQHRKYSPIIMDEADAPIEVESIQSYYQMQDAYFDKLDSRVFVVSHKGTGHIVNTIDVKELQKHGNS
jgi:hypothetical protein